MNLFGEKTKKLIKKLAPASILPFPFQNLLTNIVPAKIGQFVLQMIIKFKKSVKIFVEQTVQSSFLLR